MKKISYKISILAIISNLIVISIISFFSYLLISESNSTRINNMEENLRTSFDTLVKTQVENVISLLEDYDKKVQSGELSLKEAKKQASDLVRELRYGEDGYFWIDTVEGVNVVLLGKDAEGKNRYDAKDVNGYPLIKEIIKNGQKEGGGFTNYHFPKADSDEALPKRSYSKEFAPFKWVVGTGNYTDDIDKIVAEEESKLSEEYKKTLLWLIVVTIVSIIMSSVIAISFSKKISKPISLASEYIKILSNGDLVTEYNFFNYEKNKDETGVLIRTLQKMKISLYEMINNINNQSVKVYSVSNNSMKKMEHLKKNINSISISTEQLSSGMEETAASAEELNAVSYDLQKFSSNIANKIKDSASNENEFYRRLEKTIDLLYKLFKDENLTGNKNKSEQIIRAAENEIRSIFDKNHNIINDINTSVQSLNENLAATTTSITQLRETNVHLADEIYQIAKNTYNILKDSDSVLESSKNSRSYSFELLESVKRFDL